MQRLIVSLTLAALLVACNGVNEPSLPSSVSALAGTTPQTAPAGSPVAHAPAVIVVDGTGRAVPGVVVAFAVQAGGGTIVGATATTNSSGAAAVASWTLGATVGINILTATVANLTPVTFTATGTAGLSTPRATKSSPSVDSNGSGSLLDHPVTLPRTRSDRPALVQGQLPSGA